MKRPKEAIRKGAYGIVIHDGKVLMCHTWCRGRIIRNFPGGALDVGESPQQGLRREFEEEVGAPPEIGEVLYSCERGKSPDYPSAGLAYSYYRARLDIGRVSLRGNGDDVENLEWVPLDALPLDDMLEVDKAAWLAMRAKLV